MIYYGSVKLINHNQAVDANFSIFDDEFWVFLKTIVFIIENSLYFKKKEWNRGCQKQNICNSAIIILRQKMFNFYETVNLFPWSIKTKDKEFYHQIYAKPLLLPSVETLKLFYAPTKPFYVTNSTTWNVLLKSKSSF